jgi:hypothetical protein
MTTDIVSAFAVNWRNLFLGSKAHRYANARLQASHLGRFALLLVLARAPCFVSACAMSIEVDQ